MNSKERLIQAMPECVMFEHGITIGPGGTVRPCCAWKDLPGEPSMRWEDAWRTRHASWGQQSKLGWLPQCRECKQSEDAGTGSMRTQLNASLQGVEGIAYWDLKINNTCNLACRMCDGWSSSKWMALSRDLGLAGTPVGKPTKWHRSAIDFVDEMMFAQELKFTGGEPFLIPQVRAILDRFVELDLASSVDIQFVTNCTQDLTGWWDLFAKFRCVHLNLSIDAVGKRYEYIRPGADWHQVNTIAQQIAELRTPNCTVAVTCLEMILNTHHMLETQAWSESLGFVFLASGPIIDPDWLRVDALDKPDTRSKFIEQMTIMDRLYGTNWKDFVNE